MAKAAQASDSRNEVNLVGRLAAAPVATELPSGDVVVTMRLVVDRDSRARRPPSVDTINCSAWGARVRRSISAWSPGDTVEVEGALRRRFWQGNGGANSRYEVEVRNARRLARAED